MICPDKAWNNLAEELAQKFCAWVGEDLAEGVDPTAIILVAPMRGALPLLELCYNKLRGVLKQKNVEGMPHFSTVLQERRAEGESTYSGKISVRDPRKAKPFQRAYFVDDIIKSGGTIVGQILDALRDFHKITAVRCLFLFGAEHAEDFTYPLSLRYKNRDGGVLIKKHPSAAKKLSNLAQAYKQYFEDRDFSMKAWSMRTLWREHGDIWLMSPFEASMVELEHQGQRSCLAEMLQWVHCFSTVDKTRIKSIMVPAIAVFEKNGDVDVSYRRSFMISNEAGDFMRLKDFVPHMNGGYNKAVAQAKIQRIEKYLPEKLARYAGTICSPYLRIDKEGDDFWYMSSKDPFEGDRKAVQKKIEEVSSWESGHEASVLPGEVLVVLPAPSTAHSFDVKKLYDYLLRLFENFGYKHFSYVEEPCICEVSNAHKLRVYPITRLDEALEGVVR